MLKKKVVTYSLCAMFSIAAPLSIAVSSGHAWDYKRIDYETHNESTDPVEGVYMDKGHWKSWQYNAVNQFYRYLSYEVSLSDERKGIAFWYVKIPKTGFYQIKTAYQTTKHRTYDADYVVYANVTTAQAEAKTVTPMYSVSVDQHAADSSVSETEWATMGTFCFQENDISMLVLDGRDDDQSDSADATDWTYVGEEYNSQRCGGGVNMAPVNHLLLNRKI